MRFCRVPDHRIPEEDRMGFKIWAHWDEFTPYREDYGGFDSVYDMIYHFYWVKEMSASKIAVKLNRSTHGILGIMIKMGIPRRSKGGNNNPTGRKFVRAPI